MRLNIYGRFQLEVRRENESWGVYRLAPGKRVKVDDVVIPSTFDADEVVTYLDDLFHELAGPGQRIELLP
jgi:hypothetical protein